MYKAHTYVHFKHLGLDINQTTSQFFCSSFRCNLPTSRPQIQRGGEGHQERCSSWEHKKHVHVQFLESTILS
jgi:hypothetical protein